MEAHRRTGNFSARGGRGGGCSKQFAQKVLACCPNFDETVEKKRRSDITMHQHRPTCVVKIFLYLNLSYVLIKHVNSSLCHLTAEDMNDTIHVIVDYRVPIYLSLLISARLLTRRGRFFICATHWMIILQNTMQCSRYHSKDMYHIRKRWKHIK